MEPAASTIYALSFLAVAIAFAFAVYLHLWVKRQPTDNATIRRVSDLIKAGANTFMRKEYKILAAFAGVAAPDVEGLAEAFPTVEGRVEFVDLVLSSRVEWELPLSDIVSERGHAELVGAVLARLREIAPVRGCRGAVLAMSSKTLEEAREPSGLAWADRVRSRDERAGEGIMRALARGIGGMGTEGQGDEKDEEPREPTEAEQRRDMSDLLGYLRDFLPGGGFSGMGPMGPAAADESRGRHDGEDGPSHPLWDGPFSEN